MTPQGPTAQDTEFSVSRVSTVMNLQVIAALAIILLAFGIYNYIHTRDALLARLDEQAQNTLTRLEISLAAPLWSFDDETVEQVLRAEMHASQVVGIVVKDEGKIAYAVERGDDGQAIMTDRAPAVFALHLSRDIRYQSRSNERATLDLYMHDADVRRLMNESVMRQCVQVVGLIVVLAVLIGYLLRGSVIRPLQRVHLAKQRAQQETVENLQRLEKLKDQFLANTSHELRTPLNGMMGLAEGLLADRTLHMSALQRENLQTILSSGRRLVSLVNDILDFSKMRHEELRIHPASLDLRSYVSLVVQVLNPLADSKGLTIHNRVGEFLVPVNADEMRLQQILHNLLGNAIKFTSVGSITISAEPRDRFVAISIADTGIGIPEASIGQIFESFNQGDGSISRTYGGTGLGLSITRQIVELHGGTISVDSAPDKGSVFTFTLPISTDSQRKFATSTGDMPSDVVEDPAMLDMPSNAAVVGVGLSPFAGARILVVDDEPVNRQVLRTHLLSEGYLVVEYPGGQEAIDALDAGEAFDIALLDVMMPRVSGYDVCQRIRSRHSREDFPVVFLTARTQSQDVVTGLACGANDYLAKPFSRDELLERVRIHLQLVKARQSLEAQNDQLVDVQKKLLAQEKMATLGLLSAGIAHEINNPNNFVRASADNLKHEIDKFEALINDLLSEDVDEELKAEFDRHFRSFGHHLGLVREGTTRIADIVQSMRNSSRRDAEMRDEVDVIAQLEKTLTLVKTTYRSVSTFETAFDAKPYIACSAGQVNQVFLNLLVNACHAIESRLEQGENKAPGCVRLLSRLEGGVLRIAIIDNGCGMSEEVRQRLFEPFFTTKGEVKGTGLGMSISRDIIEGYGGRIEVITAEGVGSEMWISLPLSPVPVQQTA